jgi:hypothetical protein
MKAPVQMHLFKPVQEDRVGAFVSSPLESGSY